MKARNMALCGLFSALLAICAWIAIPVGDTIFTLQTFGVFLTLSLLGGKRGTAAIFVYLALGAVGVPVFTGFRGGVGALMGVTGGYLSGFLLLGLMYWLITKVFGSNTKIRVLAMALGLICCYVFGCLWYRFGYLEQGSAIGMGMIFAKCVLPYLLPDGCKLWLAWHLTNRLKSHI